MAGRTVLITGASSGIGRAGAVRLAEAGHRVIAAARREDRLHRLADETAGAAGSVLPVALDVRSDAAIAALVQQLPALAPQGVDVLVNAAGYALTGPVEALAVDAVRAQFETNVFGALRVTDAVLPGMRAQRRGRIVNISSVVGRVAFPGMGAYSASKFALEALSDALRMELAGFGVDVVLVEPGFVNTGIGEASTSAAAEHPEGSADYAAMHQAVTAFVREQLDKAPPPDAVAEVIARVATVRRPRARYVVPRSAAALVATLTALPTPLADRGKLAQAGLAATAPARAGTAR